jgi:pimeloyl-ACP methyl ester carboxylesterase
MTIGGQADHLGRSHRVKSGGIELHLTESGRGAPVVFLHGFPLDHTMWAAQIRQLGRRWRVIAPDLRGFGGSQVTPGVVTMEQMADDVAGALDALGVGEPIVLVGLSMGGYVAFQFVARHGSKTRGLVLCDTRSAADSPEAAAGRLKLAEHVLRAGTHYAAEAMLPRAFAPATFRENAAVTEEARESVLAASPEGVAAALHGLAQRPDMTGFLSSIRLPTLVVVGEHDAISPVEEMRSMAAAIPGSEFVVIPGAGHLPPMENPSAFNEALEGFLRRVVGHS